MIRSYVRALALALALVGTPALAQISNPGVQQKGAVTATHCAEWSGNGQIQDAGAACGSGAGTVSSVFGRVGAVVAASGDYTAAQITGLNTVNGLIKGNGAGVLSAGVNGTDFTLITANTCGAGNHLSGVTAAGVFTCSPDSAGAVTSVFGRTGVVVATSGDYTAAQITNAAAVNVTNTFTANQIFQGENGFGSVGIGTNSPATDFHMIQTTRQTFSRYERNGILGIGSEIGRQSYWGQNASAASLEWARIGGRVNPCLYKYSVTGTVASTPPCFGNENTSGNEEGAVFFSTVNGGGTMVDNAKIDNSGVVVLGTGNVSLPNGQGVTWPDTIGTMTYGISMNGNHVDLQACNAITSVNCANGSVVSLRFLTNAIGSGGLGMEIAGNQTITVNYVGGSGVAGSRPVCVDSSKRIFLGTSGAACS